MIGLRHRFIGLLLFLCLASVAQGQSGKVETPAPAASAVQILPPAVQEALEDRALLLAEIARIDECSGSCEIPIARSELQRRLQIKWARFAAWLKENGIPEDPRAWAAAGWRLNQQGKVWQMERTPGPGVRSQEPGKKEEPKKP